MLSRWYKDSTSEKIRGWAEDFMTINTCSSCDGYRLRKESLHFKLGDKHIGILANMYLDELAAWIDELPRHLNKKQNAIAEEVYMSEIIID